MTRSRWQSDPEYQQARGAALRDVDRSWFISQGVRRGGWDRVRVDGGFVTIDILMRDAVVFRRGRRFEFARFLREADLERCLAYTLLARDPHGAPVDVVAWHPRSGRLATWLGRAGLLGEEHPCPATADDPLVVFPDPVSWLAGERRGVVVVDERLARPALLDAGSVQAADIAHGQRLKAMLERVRLPRIVVPASSVRSIAA